MSNFGSWVDRSSEGKRPILVSDCPAYDALFVHYYFDRFDVRNPFVFGGMNIDSLYSGFVKDLSSRIKNSEFWDTENHTHKAVDDATIQAKALEEILKAMLTRR